VISNVDALITIYYIMPQDLSYQPFKNTYGANWEASNLPQYPLDIRLTDAAGHTVVAM
jgi:hypothetical protein